MSMTLISLASLIVMTVACVAAVIINIKLWKLRREIEERGRQWAQVSLEQLEEHRNRMFALMDQAVNPPVQWVQNSLEANVRRYDEARRRSMEWLRSHLTPLQREQMDSLGYFEVKGSTGGRYRIYTTLTATGNVAILYPDGVYKKRICFGPAAGDNLPLGDKFLAQKLALELDEPEVCRVANTMNPAYDYQFGLGPDLGVDPTMVEGQIIWR